VTNQESRKVVKTVVPSGEEPLLVKGLVALFLTINNNFTRQRYVADLLGQVAFAALPPILMCLLL
jgi:hypothetical protein